MSVLVLSRLGPKHEYFSNFKNWLKDYKQDILILTTETFVEDFKKENYTFTYSISSFDNSNDIYIKSIDIYYNKFFDKIIALDERDMITASELRDFFEIEGQSKKSALSFRNKKYMKDCITQQNIKTPNYSSINSYLDVYNFLNTHGFPIVIKEKSGFGGFGTHVIKDWGQLKVFAKDYSFSDKLIEKFIYADMYETDGIVQSDELVFISYAKNSKPPISLNQREDIYVEILDPELEICKRLKEFTVSVLHSLPNLPDTVFHCEIYVTQNEELYFCEIASRTVGRRISEAIKIVYNIDLNECLSRLQCGLPVNHLIKKEMNAFSAVYISTIKTNNLLFLPNNLPFFWINEYWPRINATTKINNSGFILATIVLHAVSTKQLNERLRLLENYLDKNVKWG
ncbi:ATP-grasp domain-containing protein [Staphylococcus saprophyticus]